MRILFNKSHPMVAQLVEHPVALKRLIQSRPYLLVKVAPQVAILDPGFWSEDTLKGVQDLLGTLVPHPTGYDILPWIKAFGLEDPAWDEPCQAFIEAFIP